MRKAIDSILLGTLGSLLVLALGYGRQDAELERWRDEARMGEEAWLHAVEDLSACEIWLYYAERKLGDAERKLDEHDPAECAAEYMDRVYLGKACAEGYLDRGCLERYGQAHTSGSK